MDLIFTDTNALVAMLCFPQRRGRLPLAHEVAAAEMAGECALLISDVVAEELSVVVERDFPHALADLPLFLESYGVVTVPRPEPALLEQVQGLCYDSDDAPILAAAVLSAERYGTTLLLSNDIETFHTPAMKRYLVKHGLAPVTLYGLLKRLGRR